MDNFLRIKAPSELPPPCPYGKKCTYGNKCKYLHSERGNTPHKSVTERLKVRLPLLTFKKLLFVKFLLKVTNSTGEKNVNLSLLRSNQASRSWK